MWSTIILGIIVALGILSFIMPLVPAVCVQRLHKAATQPGGSKHPLVKAMVGKFTALYRLKQPVNNVDSFVDKYVYDMKIGGYFLSTWMRICGQPAKALLILFGILLITGESPFRGQLADLSTLWIGLGISGLLITWNLLLQTTAKRDLAVSELQDYFANSLGPKLAQEYGITKEEYSEREQEMIQEWELQIPKAVRQKEPASLPLPAQSAQTLQKELAAARQEDLISEHEYNVIEEIMREYLS